MHDFVTRPSTPAVRLVAELDRDPMPVDASRQAARPPSPRDYEDARVPPIYHPQPLSLRISKPQISRSRNAKSRSPKYQDPELIAQHRQHRKESIAVLLEHYRDVLDGIPDREHRGSDDLLALMCPAWNHRSYQQLERRLRDLKAERPKLHAKLETRYLRYTERRVAWCKRCGEHPASHVGNVHRHPPGRSVSLKPKMLRVLPRNDDPAGVAQALDWLEARWVGRADLPKAVFEIESERRLRAA